MQALPGRILPLQLPPPPPSINGRTPPPRRSAPAALVRPPCRPGHCAPLAAAGAGVAAGCALRAGQRRGQRRAAQRAAHGRGGAEPGAPAWERVAELEEAVARLEAEKRGLEEELRQRGAPGADGEEGAPRSGAQGGEEAAGPEGAPPGPFHFPTADLPRQLEYVRVVAPGATELREACGDWLSLFRNAAPYIASFRGGAVVVHVPSFLLEEEEREAFKGVMEDVAFCSLLGLRMVLVTSVEQRLWRRLGGAWGAPRVLPGGAGRVGNCLPGLAIDERALEIAKQEAGLARVEVEGALSAGFEKRSISGGGGKATSAGIFSLRSAVSVVSSTNFFTASPLGVRGGVDYGYAGVVRSVNEELLRRRLNDGDIVSLTPLGTSPNGEVFFVSSEELAAAVARRLRAMKLVYITRGQRLIDVRHGRVVPGVQQHDAEALLGRLEGAGAEDYSAEERGSDWFLDFVRYLRLLVGAISPRGARRGHLVDPIPGALLQEFYTTDGSGTCVAQDLYQGLGRAKLADAGCILALLREDWEARGLPGSPPAEAVEAGCAAGEFFVWRRDEAVLGCAQLVARRAPPPLGLVAELRCFALAEPLFATHAGALFGYAERAAVEGRAAWLLARGEHDAERAAWLQKRGFRAPSAAEAQALPDGAAAGLLKPLDAGAAQEARESLEAFTEEQRMWGGLAA